VINAGIATREEFRAWAMKQKHKLDVSISTRLPLGHFKTLENWCSRSFRKRSELVGIVLERVLEIYEQEAGTDQPLEHFVRRLRLDRDL